MINGVRNFKLINRFGAEYDLTRPYVAFLNNPQGLGWGTETETQRLGMTYTVITDKERQSNPSGEVVFSTYAEYTRFLEFCQVGGLVFCYKPIETWYYLKCTISIDKSEIKPENDRLICPVSFLGHSYWYEQTRAESGEQEETEGKEYDYYYGYNYGVSEKNQFEFDLPLASYFKLTILGEVTNPEWRVIVNDETVKTGKVNCHISSANKFVVDTNPDSVEISEYTKRNVKVGSLYQDSVFSTERIFALPQGKSKVIVLSDDVSIPRVIMEVYRHV